MATIADELNAISVEHGYTGAAPKTIADAIDALADTLAGEDVKGGRSIAGAIHALAPYIGSGGGGGFEPKGMSSIEISEGILGTGPTGFYAGTNEPSTDGPIIMFNDANVCMAEGSEYIAICGGLNVMASLPLASGVDADSVGVFYGDSEVPSTKKVLTQPTDDRVLFIAFTTPEVEDGETATLSITTNGGYN